MEMLTEKAMAEWLETKVAVELTNQEWSRLETFLEMSRHFREEERDGWAKLAEEKDEAGNPIWTHAVSNAEFWRQQIEIIDNIIKAIENRW